MNNLDNIILIGMRGSGKSTVGKHLAKALSYAYIDCDKLLEKNHGQIKDIVATHGWDTFRDIESETIESLTDIKKHIIATGGGAILREKNVSTLRSLGTLLYLHASIPTLIARIGEDPNRPSLTGATLAKDMEETLEKRSYLYTNSSDYLIDTEGKTIGTIVKEITQLLNVPYLL